MGVNLYVLKGWLVVFYAYKGFTTVCSKETLTFSNNCANGVLKKIINDSLTFLTHYILQLLEQV